MTQYDGRAKTSVATTSEDDDAPTLVSGAPIEGTPAAANLATSLESGETVGTLGADARLKGQSRRLRIMSPPRIDPEHAERVISSEVQKAIVSRLATFGIAPKNIEDVAQDVTLQLLVLRKPPSDLAGCLATALVATKNEALDHRRKTKRRAKYNVGPTDTPDDHVAAEHASPDAADALDRKKQLELIEEKRADGSLSEKAARMLELDAQGMNAVEIAKEVHLAPQTVRNTLSAVKRELRLEWARRVGVVAGTLGVLVLVVWVVATRESVSAQAPPHEAPPAPSESAAPPAVSQRRPAELRERAFDECRRGALVACQRDLDEARALDPDGDSAPRVQAARRAIHEGRPLVDDGTQKRTP
jgi:DNA-directed RNA polymerase specialized sigma24 family protein